MIKNKRCLCGKFPLVKHVEIIEDDDQKHTVRWCYNGRSSLVSAPKDLSADEGIEITEYMFEKLGVPQKKRDRYFELLEAQYQAGKEIDDATRHFVACNRAMEEFLPSLGKFLKGEKK